MVVVGFDMVYKKDGDALYSSPKSRNDPLLKRGRVQLNEDPVLYTKRRSVWRATKKKTTMTENDNLESLD